MNALELAINALMQRGPKFGRRYLLGQPRCTEYIDVHHLVDRSEARSAAEKKYQPHQGERERNRRLRQMARSV